MLLTDKKLEPTLHKKCQALEKQLQQYQSLVIAFSGGVDSTFLLKFASELPGLRTLALVGDSPSLPRHELDAACNFLNDNNIPFEIVHPEEMQDKNYTSNPANRCYFCKTHLFSTMVDFSRKNGIEVIADGTNADDLRGHRPGKQAGEEHLVISPLADCGFTKEDVRLASRAFGLPTWQKPAMACLASRFPTGESIDTGKLAMVEAAEQFLFSLGFSQVRVRFHEGGSLARIELLQTEISRAIEHSNEIVQALKSLGFKHVSLDLQGYRQGSLSQP